MQAFLHLTSAEIGPGLIALVVLAAALSATISALILLMLAMRRMRARLSRLRRRDIAQAGPRVGAQAGNLASQRAR